MGRYHADTLLVLLSVSLQMGTAKAFVPDIQTFPISARLQGSWRAGPFGFSYLHGGREVELVPIRRSSMIRREHRTTEFSGRMIPRQFVVSPASRDSRDPESAEKSSKAIGENEAAGGAGHSVTTNRRKFMQSIALLSSSSVLHVNCEAANARGLVRFPATNGLANTYHFMRAGESLLEAEDVLSTNPLFLTNREAALSELGIKQVEDTCANLKAKGITPTVVRYSLAASATDTSNIVGRELKVGRDRLVPEFNFMDPRAVGKWDMLPLSKTQAAVWAMDADEAGKYGTGARPPPNDDSTPHETLADQVTRLTQLVSVLDTQYSGDTILLVFPDGTGPALLSALIGGVPLNRVHELNFNSGEVRLDITVESVNRCLPSVPTSEYTEVLDRGRKELKILRETSDQIVNVKDQRYEAERILADEEQKRLARAREEAKQAEAEAASAKEKAEREARRERGLKQEQERQKKRQEAAAARELSKRRRSDDISEGGESSSADIDNLPAVLASLAVSAIGAVALANREEDASVEPSTISRDGALNGNIKGNGTFSQTALADDKNKTVSPVDAAESTVSNLEYVEISNDERLGSQQITGDMGEGVDEDRGGKFISDGEEGEASAVVAEAPDPQKRAQKAMKEYIEKDDGGDAWLAMISEIVTEEEEEQVSSEP